MECPFQTSYAGAGSARKDVDVRRRILRGEADFELRAQEALDGGVDGIDIERLRNEGIGAHCAGLLRTTRRGAHHDDMAGEPTRAKLGVERLAAHRREHEVEDHERRRLRSRYLEGTMAVRRDAHLVLTGKEL